MRDLDKSWPGTWELERRADQRRRRVIAVLFVAVCGVAALAVIWPR